MGGEAASCEWQVVGGRGKPIASCSGQAINTLANVLGDGNPHPLRFNQERERSFKGVHVVEIAEAVLIAGSQLTAIDHRINHNAEIVGAGNAPVLQDCTRQVAVLELGKVAQAGAQLLAADMLCSRGDITLRSIGGGRTFRSLERAEARLGDRTSRLCKHRADGVTEAFANEVEGRLGKGSRTCFDTLGLTWGQWLHRNVHYRGTVVYT